MPRMRRAFAVSSACGALLLAALLPAACPAAAQPAPAATETGPADIPVGTPVDMGPEPGDPVARCRELNREQACLAQEQLDANAASQKAHDDAVDAARMQTLRDNATYSAALEAHQKAVDKYHADYAAWEKIVAACKRGNRKLCPPAKGN